MYRLLPIQLHMHLPPSHLMNLHCPMDTSAAAGPHFADADPMNRLQRRWQGYGCSRVHMYRLLPTQMAHAPTPKPPDESALF